MAIKHKLEGVADHLCEVLGTELSSKDGQGNSPLWVALRSRQEAIASKLVRYAMCTEYDNAIPTILISSAKSYPIMIEQ